jgi:hypothetical protein
MTSFWLGFALGSICVTAMRCAWLFVLCLAGPATVEDEGKA